ncbi:Mg/Co/Ni transporter MgtE [Fusibacter sp. 3D3]|nr:Mg/Co/Ni transporter MgtE [Fusibacter sp. 3D3]
MIGNLVIAGFFGFLIPMLLKKLKLDPAVSSSIFLTTAKDVGGFFLFLGLAKLFLPHLL